MNISYLKIILPMILLVLFTSGHAQDNPIKNYQIDRDEVLKLVKKSKNDRLQINSEVNKRSLASQSEKDQLLWLEFQAIFKQEQ